MGGRVGAEQIVPAAQLKIGRLEPRRHQAAHQRPAVFFGVGETRCLPVAGGHERLRQGRWLTAKQHLFGGTITAAQPHELEQATTLKEP
jgi:hypothetical protein